MMEVSTPPYILNLKKITKIVSRYYMASKEPNYLSMYEKSTN